MSARKKKAPATKVTEIFPGAASRAPARVTASSAPYDEDLSEQFDNIFEVLREVRHAIDKGTGAGIYGDEENEGAKQHRLEAHDQLTNAELFLDSMRTKLLSRIGAK